MQFWPKQERRIFCLSTGYSIILVLWKRRPLSRRTPATIAIFASVAAIPDADYAANPGEKNAERMPARVKRFTSRSSAPTDFIPLTASYLIIRGLL